MQPSIRAATDCRSPSPPARPRDRECPALPVPDWVMKPKVPSLLQAVRAGSLQGVRAALEDDPFVAFRGQDRRREPILITALLQACSPQLITVLLRAGADPNDHGPDGKTALDVLVASQGACGAEEARSGEPCMQHVSLDALWDGQPGDSWEIALATAQDMAAYGDPDSIGTGPASDAWRCACAATLLAFGADASRKGKDGVSAAERAEQAGHASFAQYLLHWAGGELDMMRRTSRSFAKRTPTLPGMSAAHSLGAPAPQVGNPTAPLQTAQGSLKGLPDDLLVCIFNMLAPTST